MPTARRDFGFIVPARAIFFLTREDKGFKCYWQDAKNAEKMNYLGASPRGIKKANAHGESGTDPRVGVLTKKRIK